jgi:hypothetical protein
MTSPPTVNAFTETAALYAVLNDDDLDARRIVGQMHAGERATFSAQLSRLMAIVEPSDWPHTESAKPAQPPTTWTAPDGTVYDLRHGLRDADGDVWVCLGWWQPFDGDPVPLVECDNAGRTDLPDAIASYGPMDPRDEDAPTVAQ